MLGFPWIPLAESGLFNGLHRIQAKNSFSLSHCGGNITNRDSCSWFALVGRSEARAISGQQKDIYHRFIFSARNHPGKSYRRASGRRGAGHCEAQDGTRRGASLLRPIQLHFRDKSVERASSGPSTRFSYKSPISLPPQRDLTAAPRRRCR